MSASTHPLAPEERRVRRAHLAVTLVLLAACAVVYLGGVLLTIGDLPRRLAVSFGADGRADGLMSTPLALLVFGVVALGVPALLLTMAVTGQWWRGSSARVTSAFVSGLACGLVALFVHLLWSQQGLVDPLQARLLPMAAVWSIAVALAVGLLVAAVLPRPLPQPGPVVAEPIDLAPSDRVSWFGRAVTSRAVGTVLAGVVLLVLVLMLALQEWWLLIVLGLLLLVLPAVSVFQVTVDRSGLAWRSALGWPRGRVAIGDVVGATVVQVRPGDYGGYGFRSVPGATGLITRPGEALSVIHRRGAAPAERRLVITVDDALTAASVLEELRRRTG